MSAGNFTRSRYEATYDNTQIHPIRVQPETLLMADASSTSTVNAPPSAGVTNPISAEVSTGKRSLGLKPRKFNMVLAGTPPTGYSLGSRVSLPILTESFYTALSINDTINYLGTTWTLVSKSPEVVS